MKKLLLAVVIVSVLNISADAQTGEKKTMAKHGASHHKHKKHSNTSNSYAKHHIKVSSDDPNAPYEGKNSKANDGVQKNKQRNLNYQNNGQTLPPNSGNNSK